MPKKNSNADKIRGYLLKHPNATAPQIAKATGTKTQYVYNVLYADRKKGEVKPKQQWRVTHVMTADESIEAMKKDGQPRMPDGRLRMQPATPVIAHLAEQAKKVEALLAPKALDVQIGGDHYKTMAIQPVEFITKNSLGFLEGSIIKRICRWRTKDGIKDLNKIKHEVDLLIQLNGLQ